MSSVADALGHYFKPEVRKQGEDYFSEGSVVLSQATDSQIRSYLKGSASARVTFLADSIESPTFNADCTCTSAKKGQLCKHVWATILMVESDFPDFFACKKDIEKSTGAAKESVAKRTSPEQLERQATAKEKQSDYRRQQYQKQKQRIKDRKSEGKQKASLFATRPNYPDEVEAALKYFSENGFAMESGPDEETLKTAKRQLARVFHPDKGGTQDEILTLISNFDLLMEYLAESKV